MNNHKKILVADDDSGVAEMLKVMLEDNGYEVETTNDGKTVEEVKEFRPDVILLDIWMSGMDGRDICKRLKSRKQTKKIPVIMVSANKDAKQIALESGAEDFLAKPFEMEILLKKINKYL